MCKPSIRIRCRAACGGFSVNVPGASASLVHVSVLISFRTEDTRSATGLGGAAGAFCFQAYPLKLSETTRANPQTPRAIHQTSVVNPQCLLSSWFLSRKYNTCHSCAGYRDGVALQLMRRPLPRPLSRKRERGVRKGVYFMDGH
jgi:hypothetical protein